MKKYINGEWVDIPAPWQEKSPDKTEPKEPTTTDIRGLVALRKGTMAQEKEDNV